MVHYRMIFPAAFILGAIFISPPVQARVEKSTTYLSTAEMLAGQVEDSAAVLLHTVESLPPEVDISDTAGRLRSLREAAAAFRHENRVYYLNPDHTKYSWEVLLGAYATARPAIALLPNSRGAHEAAHKLVDSMYQLSRYYPGRVYPVVPGGPAPARADWLLRQHAGDIMRLSGNLAAHVRDLELRGLASQGAAERFSRLGQAAASFYNAVQYEPAGSRTLQNIYAELVARLQDARDVVGNTNLNVQRDLGKVWGLAQELSFVTPGVELGYYDISSFQR